jgi:hypothetical protein
MKAKENHGRGENVLQEDQVDSGLSTIVISKPFPLVKLLAKVDDLLRYGSSVKG